MTLPGKSDFKECLLSQVIIDLLMVCSKAGCFGLFNNGDGCQHRLQLLSSFLPS